MTELGIQQSARDHEWFIQKTTAGFGISLAVSAILKMIEMDHNCSLY